MLSGKRVVRNVHKCHVTHDCKSGANSHCRKSLAIPPFHFCNCCWVGFFSMTKIKVLYIFGQWAVSSNQYTVHSMLSGKPLVTQAMLQLRPNWSELRSMDCYHQIFCRFRKCKQKLPPPSPLSTQKSPFTPPKG